MYFLLYIIHVFCIIHNLCTLYYTKFMYFVLHNVHNAGYKEQDYCRVWVELDLGLN